MSILEAFNFMDHWPGLGPVQVNPNIKKHNLNWSREKVFRQKQYETSWYPIYVKYINIDSNFLLVSTCFNPLTLQ